MFPQFSLNTAYFTNFPDQLSLRKNGATVTARLF